MPTGAVLHVPTIRPHRTKCTAPTACGYCAETYSSRDCPQKTDRGAIRKYPTCRGAQEALEQAMPGRESRTNQSEISLRFTPTIPSCVSTTRLSSQQDTGQRNPSGVDSNRSRTWIPETTSKPHIIAKQPRQQRVSPNKRMPKRVNTGNETGAAGTRTEM